MTLKRYHAKCCGKGFTTQEEKERHEKAIEEIARDMEKRRENNEQK